MKGTCKRKIFPPQPAKRGYAEKDGGRWIAFIMAVLTVLICIPFQAAFADDTEFVDFTIVWHGAEPTPIDVIVMKNELGGYYEATRETVIPTYYRGNGEWVKTVYVNYSVDMSTGAPFIAVSRSTIDGKWYCDKWDSNNWLYQPGQYGQKTQLGGYTGTFFLTSSAPTDNSITVTHAWASGTAPVDTTVELYKYYSTAGGYKLLSSSAFPAGQTSLTINGLYGGDYYVAHTYPASYSDNAPDKYFDNSATKVTLSSGTAAAVPVTITYTPPKYYVNIASTPGGTVSADKTQALEGETVNLTVTPGTDKRYKAGSLKYTDTLGAHPITGTSFTMPGGAVTVSAEFEPKQYTIGVSASAGGLVTADKSSSVSGQVISVTVTPDMGKQLRPGTLKYTDSSGDHVITGGGFTMPQSNVILSAEFEPKQYTIGAAAAPGGLVTADRSSSASGQVIGVTVTPNAGKQLRPGTLKYTDSLGDHAITGGGFTMPQSNVTLSAQFETPVSIVTGTFAGGMKGSAYAATVSAQDGWAPYQWSAEGLPEGLAIGQDTGEISGTPNKSGSFDLNITVTDTGGTLAQRTLSLYIVGGGTDGEVLILSGYGGIITVHNDGTYLVAAAAAGFVIDQLWVDGSVVSAASGLKNYEVTSAEKSIVATFAYTVNFQTPTNGTLAVTSAGGSIASGTNVTSGTIIHGGDRLNIMVSADAGFCLETLTVNGVDVTEKYDEANGYTFTVGGAATLDTGSARTIGSSTVGTKGAYITASFVPESACTATVAVNRDGSLWTAGAPFITIGTDSASALQSGSAFADGTYHIYANGAYTGTNITVSGAVASAVLNYYTLTLTAGTGITSVSGDGVYLSGSYANIDAAVMAGYTWEKWSDENTLKARTVVISTTLSLTATAAVPFVAVTGITGVPTIATAGTDLPLFGTVAPANTTNQAIEWSIRNAGTTGASITGNVLSTAYAGIMTVRASIAGGTSADMAYTQDFDITVNSNLIYRVLVKQASSMIIQAEGLFTPNAELIVIPIKADETEREKLEALLSDKETAAAFEVHVTPSNAFQPPLTLHFQVGTQYDGRTLYILHRLSSGEVEQFTIVVANGEAVITVQELSPFLLAVDPRIIIASQPQNITVMAGQTATFSVSAAGAEPLTYQWQKKTGLNALWEDIEGAVYPDHTTTQANKSNSGFQYRVIITDALGGSAASNAATLTVVQPPDTGDDSQPALYLLLMLLFMASIILLLRKRKTVDR